MVKNGRHHANGTSSRETQRDATPCQPSGTLVVIGGKEKKEGDRPILELLAQRVGSGKLIVATLASEEPQTQWQEYQKTFRELGVQRIEHLDVRRREELLENPRLELLDDLTVLFFAGGDQRKITSRFGGTPLCDRLRELYEKGVTVAGTSSGASVMTEVMMASGETDESNVVGGSLRLVPGLGFLSGVIIDQHFAERGRMGRLLGAVTQNPRLLGVGIDEDTALVFQGHTQAATIGSGAVYIVDGRHTAYSNAAEEVRTMSVFNIKLHALTEGDQFDLTTREPRHGPRERVEQN
jgi:cyanophycinase